MSFLRGLAEAMQAETAKGQQVVLVGDLNIAHGQVDVYPSPENEAQYHSYSYDEIAWINSVFGEAPSFAPAATSAGEATQEQHASLRLDGPLCPLDESAGTHLLPAETCLGQVHKKRRIIPEVAAPTAAAAGGEWGGQLDLHSTIRAGGLAVGTAKLVDLFRLVHPPASKEDWAAGKGHYSCFDQRRFHRLTNKGVRIDYIACSPSLLHMSNTSQQPAVKVDTLNVPVRWSDHLPVRCILRSEAAQSMRVPTSRSDSTDARPLCAFIFKQRKLLKPMKSSRSITSFFARTKTLKP
jgi:exonuclease III